jgi:hypothetical protein
MRVTNKSVRFREYLTEREMDALMLAVHIPAQDEHPFRFNVNICSGRT